MVKTSRLSPGFISPIPLGTNLEDIKFDPAAQIPVILQQHGQDYQYEHIQSDGGDVNINGTNHLKP
jgi:hypothetical protein